MDKFAILTINESWTNSGTAWNNSEPFRRIKFFNTIAEPTAELSSVSSKAFKRILLKIKKNRLQFFSQFSEKKTLTKIVHIESWTIYLR